MPLQSLQYSQLEFFQKHGYLRVKGFHPPVRMAAVRKSILDELKRLRVWASGKNLPSPLHALPPFQQIARLSTLVKVQGLGEALMTPPFSSLVADLAQRVPPPARDMQLLLSLSRQGTWTLEGLNWHVDVAAEPQDPLPGIQAFFLIDDVAPRGGATLALAGSHRANVRQAGTQPPLRELLRKPGSLDASLAASGVTVVEMSGRAGDLFLMDMRLLHTPSINSTKHIRMMATARFLLNT